MNQQTLVTASDSNVPVRRFINSTIFGVIVCVCVCCASQPDSAQAADRQPGEPGWLPVVVATGALREQIEATPIENRPYRPFHFYGNTVRRMHYHGTMLPRFGDGAGNSNRLVARRSRSNVIQTARESRSVSR